MFMFYQVRYGDSLFYSKETTLSHFVANDFADSESERCFILTDSQVCCKSRGFFLTSIEKL